MGYGPMGVSNLHSHCLIPLTICCNSASSEDVDTPCSSLFCWFAFLADWPVDDLASLVWRAPSSVTSVNRLLTADILDLAPDSSFSDWSSASSSYQYQTRVTIWSNKGKNRLLKDLLHHIQNCYHPYHHTGNCSYHLQLQQAPRLQVDRGNWV